MATTYGVLWRDGDLPLAAGRLELGSGALRLHGLSGNRPAECEVAYDALAGVRIGRLPAERINGRPTVILERREGEPIAITSVSGLSAVGEIADRLSAAQPAMSG